MAKKQKTTNTHSWIYLQFMSLNDIRLTAFLTTEMYKDALIETDDLHRQLPDINQQTVPLSETQPAEKTWKYLGKFQKKILFVVQYENAVHIPDEQLNFLTGILTACKLTLADIAILNLLNAPSSIHKTVHEKFQPAVTILLGISPKQFEMPINFPEFQVQPFNNCTFLFAPAVEEISSDKLLKSKLWVSLRKIFGI